MTPAMREEWNQFRILSRDSLRKLLNTAVLSREADPAQFAVWTTVLVATPPAMYAFGQPFKYARLASAPIEIIDTLLMHDRMFFIVYGMIAMALLAALTWEALFPDRDDQEIVGALPVRPRTLAGARLAASLIMAGGFALALSLPAALLFSFVATTHPAMGFLPVVFLAHFFSSVAGCLAVFTLLLVIRGVVAFAVGSDVADRLATLLQLASVIALVEVFFYLPTVLPLLVDRMFAGLTATQWLPPAWFVALYSTLVGTEREALRPQAWRAVHMLLAAGSLVLPIYALSAPIMARRALDTLSKAQPGTLARIVRSAGRIAPHPATRAVTEFAITTLWRSRRHLLVVVSYAGAGVAIAAISIIAARLRAGLLSPELNTSALAVPLVMMFLLVFGLRAAFRLPGDLQANWPFRLAPPSTSHAASGTQLAMMVLAVAPVTMLAAAAALFAGVPLATAGKLVVFDLAAGWLLLEAVLLNWTRVPFACAHAVSEETAKYKWMLYLIPLNLFAFRGADAQLAAVESDRAGAVYLTVVLAVAIAIRAVRMARGRRHEVAFDPPPDLRLEVLNLSEALQ